MNVYVETLGFAASVVSFVLWWPQAMRVWQCRRSGEHLSGVSLSSQALLLVNAALWGAYAIVTGSLWVGAPGLVNGPLAIVTIVIVHRARHEVARPTLPARRGRRLSQVADVVRGSLDLRNGATWCQARHEARSSPCSPIQRDRRAPGTTISAGLVSQR